MIILKTLAPILGLIAFIMAIREFLGKERPKKNWYRVYLILVTLIILTTLAIHDWFSVTIWLIVFVICFFRLEKDGIHIFKNDKMTE